MALTVIVYTAISTVVTKTRTVLTRARAFTGATDRFRVLWYWFRVRLGVRLGVRFRMMLVF